MHRKHYQAIAEIVRFRQRATEGEDWLVVAENIATYFLKRDPRFDRARFLAACGLSERVESHD